jgi:monofunctional biosynthetic peptidoglycan transglycosylase
MLIEFNDAEEIRLWTAINDDLMGGISQSRIELSPAATALFSGQLALENNGGFASIRRRADNYNLRSCLEIPHFGINVLYFAIRR